MSNSSTKIAGLHLMALESSQWKSLLTDFFFATAQIAISLKHVTLHLRTRYSDIIQQKFSRARKIRQIHNNFCSPDSLTPAHIWIPPHPPSQNPHHNLNLHNTVSISQILEIFEKIKIHLKVIFSAQCQIFVVLVVLSCIFLNKSFQIRRTKHRFEKK